MNVATQLGLERPPIFINSASNLMGIADTTIFIMPDYERCSPEMVARMDELLRYHRCHSYKIQDVRP
jgi:hypothetical protein